ncbi:MAG: DUF4091 domain-containing protein [Phycisphaerae bacterium]|nr:DUF4091 domain-containing protein [Phycisphaerae bacterium]
MNAIRRIQLAGALGIMALACTGCKPIPTEPGSLKIWAASDMVALTDKTPSFSDTSLLALDNKTISLFAAANETVSFQLIIDAPDSGADGVKIIPSRLEGTPQTSQPISAKQIQPFRMLPIKVNKFPAWYLRLASATPQPARFYDPLVPIDAPRGGQPYRLAGGRRLAVWIDIKVPRTTQADTYRGKITITSSPFKTQSIPVELKIYPFALPGARPIAAVGGFDHNVLFRQFVRRGGRPFEPVYLDPKRPEIAEGLKIIRKMMVLAHEHRLDLFDKRIRPKIIPGVGGKIRLDWTGYDAIVAPYLSGKAFADNIGCSAWPIPVSGNWPVPKYYGGIKSKRYAETIEQLIRQSGRHFRAIGAEEQIFAWPVRGAISNSAYRRFVQMAGLFKKYDPSIPVLSQLPTTPPRKTRWKPPAGLAEQIDILSPPAQYLDPAEAPRRTSPKNPLLGVWLSPGQPPYLPGLSILASPADVRAIPWFAMKYQCTGLFLPEVLNWSGDIFAKPGGAQTRLFYPGSKAGINGVLPSIRLKRLRRGLQDIAYIWILQQRQRKDLARAIVNAMVRYAGMDAIGDHYLDPRINGWIQQGETWHDARRMLAIEVTQAIHTKIGSRQQIANRIRWQRFTDHTSAIRAERVQAFMASGQLPLIQFTPNPDADTRSLRATVLVDLYNEFARDVQCSVRVKSLPTGWKAVLGEHVFPRFPAGQRKKARLIIEGIDLKPTYNGKIPVAVEIAMENGRKTILPTEVAFIVAEAVGKPPVIDGKLNDWPTGTRNSVGDFRLLGRRGRSFKKGLAGRQTTAYAMQDKKNLYFAIRCNEPTLAEIVTKPTNFVRYEQLLACGEDLVEILLDPGAKAQGPEDLYHIIIKPNGIVIQEMGIRTDPPLGVVRSHSLGAKVAIGREKNAWLIEMKIPRSAFGADGKEEFWGINFTRFASQGSEASSWAGCRRYFYDPRNLGTMFVFQQPKP